VVLRLQNNIKTGFDAINKIEGQVVIYGKKGHAEVNGLLGQTQGNGIVISDFSDLDSIDFSKPINIFSQTTKSLEGYEKITEEIKCRMKAATGKEDIQFIANKTICSQVSKRDVELKTFSLSHEVIIFVSGIKSSNGKVLFDVCRKQNPSSYFVSDSDDLNPAWFAGIETVGICGATSTPRWLMEKIHDEIFKLIEK
jgi:4-hydroxy-3-methylbut-2-enyl diphosphate reductase